jgi:hypothetical protein
VKKCDPLKIAYFVLTLVELRSSNKTIMNNDTIKTSSINPERNEIVIQSVFLVMFSLKYFKSLAIVYQDN